MLPFISTVSITTRDSIPFRFSGDMQPPSKTENLYMQKEYIQYQQDMKCGFLLGVRSQLKCDGTRAETRFRLSEKRTSPFKSAGASVQSITGSRGVHISGSNAGYTMFRGSVKGTGYPLHSPVSPSLPLPCVTVCNHISTGVYLLPICL